MSEPTLLAEQERRAWWREISGYQWLVLIIASAGWIFDIYENQIFIVTRGSMLSELLRQPAGSGLVKYYGDAINSYFLVGGALGGVMFGMIADRWGRSRSMILSILVYAVFSAMTAGAHAVWHVKVLRFLVAMGTGGEWAVAAALVSEAFPKRARAHASGIFHASSVLGVGAAGVAGMITGGNWRMTFLLGLVPAILVLVVRIYIREPRGGRAGDGAELQTGPAQPEVAGRVGFAEFWHNREYRKRAMLGLLLAAVGLAGYWGVFAAGQDLARGLLVRHGMEVGAAEQKAKFAYAVVQNIGGGVGLFAMGPLCAWLGRKRAFVMMQVGALVVTPAACFLPESYEGLLVMLPLMAFFVGGMHAGYAVWFPELFPARIRATGAGLCFNGGRLVASGTLMFAAWLKSRPGMDLRTAVTVLAGVYVVGVVVAAVMPETKGQALDE